MLCYLGGNSRVAVKPRSVQKRSSIQLQRLLLSEKPVCVVRLSGRKTSR